MALSEQNVSIFSNTVIHHFWQIKVVQRHKNAESLIDTNENIETAG